METETMTATQALQAFADRHGLTLAAQFVPFSQSRNAVARNGAEKPWRSLNWRVTLRRATGTTTRDILTSDYSQGEAHCPAYKKKWADNRFIKARAIDIEIETGCAAKPSFGADEATASRTPVPPPSIVDVLSSLALDGGAIDYPNFEGWAAEFGYDSDSRTAESMWRECVETGLALRAALGNDAFEELATLAGEL